MLAYKTASFRRMTACLLCVILIFACAFCSACEPAADQQGTGAVTSDLPLHTSDRTPPPEIGNLSEPEEDAETALPPAFTVWESGICMAIDPRIELYQIIWYLTGQGNEFFETNEYDLEYKKEVDAYFGEFKDHKVVKYLITRLNPQMNEPMTPQPDWLLDIMSCMNPDFTYDEARYSEMAKEQMLSTWVRYYRIPEPEAFITMLKDFCAKTNFAAFFNAHRAYYNDIVVRIIDGMPSLNVSDAVRDYLGYYDEEAFFAINPVLLLTLDRAVDMEIDGQLYDFSLLQISGATDGQPELPTLELSLTLAYRLLSYAIPENLFAESTELNRALRESGGIWNNGKSVTEHVNEVMIVYANLYVSHLYKVAMYRALDDILDIDELFNRNYVLATAMNDQPHLYSTAVLRCAYEMLSEYEENRDAYPAFEDYLPRLIDRLKTEAPEPIIPDPASLQ